MSYKSDFDFLIGKWTINNRMLKEPLSGSNKWRRFEASLEAKRILSGFGNQDIFRAIINSRYFEGTTLRLFNPATKLWSLHWVDNWSVILQPPLIGKFANGKGIFFSTNKFKDKIIQVRFIWRDITVTTAFWEQSFSEDGENWETNWTMEFSKKN